MKITVVLPCAGSGFRLGLNTPKELYEIIPGIKLIDFSLMHIKKYLEKFPDSNLEVAVVIRKEKIKVFDYVEKALPGINVIQVEFNDNYYEWAGSVYSANKYFNEKNIVLLPDSVIEVGNSNPFFDSDGNSLLQILSGSLEQNKVSFGYIESLDKNKFSKLGALKIINDKVISFQDKPVNNFNEYNAFWATYGFRKEYGESLYKFLESSIKHGKNNYENENFYPAGSFRLYSYADLGTWESINYLKSVFNKKLFGF